MDSEIAINLKIDLLINGVALDGEFDLEPRNFLDSISDGINFIIFEDIYITASIKKESPYILYFNKTNGDIFLKGKNIHTLNVKLISKRKYFGVKTSDGAMMDDIGTCQTDRLRISAYKGCKFQINNEGCKFCESYYKKTQHKNQLEHISELIKYVECHEERIKHYLVSGGTPPDNGWDHFVDVCKTINKNSIKPIYAMFSPPPHLKIIKRIIEAGVQDVAINIELFNQNFSIKIMKGKHRIGIDKYFKALEYSVEILGNKGNVKSLLIVGIENYSDTLAGIEELAKRGVMPILSIFKPIKGTPLENFPVPKKEDLVAVWENAQNICEKFNLTLGPLCKCCQNNTLSIPINSKYFKYE
jgi:uncharacterized radical SAM superfamily protein